MEGERPTVVVVDDDREMVNILVEILGAGGYRALAANSGVEALNLVRREHPDLVISDLRMVGMSGHQLHAEIKRAAPSLPVVIITAFGSIQTAVESMKLGAFDYITKPFSNDELLLVVSRALEDRNLRQEIKRLRGELAHSYGLENIIAASRKMTEVLEIVGHIADSAASVLLAGESGTGKELIARSLHFRSRRQQGPFIPVNCAAIPDNLLESELFGHVKGAFTDARQSKAGLFQAARSGTLFLDEVGEMPLMLQAKLLRVIEDKRVRPVGATEETPVDVRIVSATNADLEEAIAAGKFRADLYYRLATVTLVLPPLRERTEDIMPLVKHFLARASAEAGRPVPEVDADAMAGLTHYQWPGNIRELQNAISRAVILCRNDRITRGDLPAKVAGGEGQTVTIDDAVNRRLTMDQLEREYARAVLASVGGNKSEAATVLGIDRKTLYRKLGEPDAN
ncbi:MAG TPA: sigma-54 dependent transcriptional regulator [Candidatus Binataceae bacterium]|nr:sigma-54 dependent transcriptional regulator [Candidatus Binataceae bacterium]